MSACKRSSAQWMALWLFAAAANAAETTVEQIQADKQALAPLQVYVGGWRGVGQLRRGSNQGAWTETADWAWKFSGERAALVFEAPKGKYYTSGRLSAGEKPGVFELLAMRAEDKSEDRFTGGIDDKQQLVLVADKPADD